MRYFTYEAYDRGKVLHRGRIRARDEHDVEVLLRGEGLEVDRVTPAKVQVSPTALLRGVGSKDRIEFTQNLVALLKARRIQLPEALEIVHQQTEHPLLRQAIDDMQVRVRTGRLLAPALREHPRIFDRRFVSMVAAGEESGLLVRMLEDLVLEMKRDDTIVGKIKRMLVQPAVLFFAVVLITIVMTQFVLPQVADVFDQLGFDLPLPTRMLLAAADLVRAAWLPLGTLFVALCIAIPVLWKRREVRERVDPIVLRIPVVGPVLQAAAVGRFTRTFAALLAAGTPLPEALSLSGETAGNSAISRVAEEARGAISNGLALQTTFREAGSFPPNVVGFMAVGVSAGALPEQMRFAGEAMQTRFDDRMDTLLEVMPHVLLAVFLSLALFVAAALYWPILLAATRMGQAL